MSNKGKIVVGYYIGKRKAKEKTFWIPMEQDEMKSDMVSWEMKGQMYSATEMSFTPTEVSEKEPQ